MAKEGRIKKYWERVKQYKQNRTFVKIERKFYQQVGGENTKTHERPDAKETKQFGSKIWEHKEYNRMAEWINNMKKKLQGLEEDLEANI